MMNMCELIIEEVMTTTKQEQLEETLVEPVLQKHKEKNNIGPNYFLVGGPFENYSQINLVKGA